MQQPQEIKDMLFCVYPVLHTTENTKQPQFGSFSEQKHGSALSFSSNILETPGEMMMIDGQWQYSQRILEKPNQSDKMVFNTTHEDVYGNTNPEKHSVWSPLMQGVLTVLGFVLLQLQRALFIMMGSQSAANRSFIILLSERLIAHTFFFFPSSSQTY